MFLTKLTTCSWKAHPPVITLFHPAYVLTKTFVADPKRKLYTVRTLFGNDVVHRSKSPLTIFLLRSFPYFCSHCFSLLPCFCCRLNAYRRLTRWTVISSHQENDLPLFCWLSSVPGNACAAICLFQFSPKLTHVVTSLNKRWDSARYLTWQRRYSGKNSSKYFSYSGNIHVLLYLSFCINWRSSLSVFHITQNWSFDNKKGKH